MERPAKAKAGADERENGRGAPRTAHAGSRNTADGGAGPAAGAGAGSRREENAAAGWMHGAVVLGAAALVSKLIGTLQKIPLQNVAGDRVFGLYNAVYPFYQLVLFLATAGLPVAVSLLVAEETVRGREGGARRVLRTASLLLGAAGVAAFGAMWVAAGPAARLIGDEAAYRAIRASAAALLFVPVLAAFRGYYQGLHRPIPSAVSQVVEQSVRVAAMLALLAAGWAAGWSDGALAAGATAGSAAGGAAGLAAMMWLWRRERKRKAEAGSGGRGEAPAPAAAIARDGNEEAAAAAEAAVPHVRPHVGQRETEAAGGSRPLWRRLLALALPVAAGAVAVPLAGIVDAFTVPRLLMSGGMSPEAAMTAFGLYGRGQPLVQLVVMLAGAVAGALAPALAAARAAGRRAEAAQQAGASIRAGWLIGAGASAGLALLAAPMNAMLYGDEQASLTFALVGCTTLAGTLNAVTAAVLQGLGRVYLPALCLLLATLLKAVLNAALVPAFGIDGAAWAGVVSLTAAALLGAAAVRREAGAAGGGVPAPRFAAGAALALACMAAALLLLERGYAALRLPPAVPERAGAALLALTGTAVGAAVFAAALLLGGAVGARELRAVPGGGRLAGRLRRWRLLRG